MRLSDDERERFFGRLSRHAAAGRISFEELERRVAAVAAAETREQASAVLADLPPLPPDSLEAERPPRHARGHGEADAPEPDWTPTEERFRDPRSGRVMRVWSDAGGGRHYLPDDS